MRLLIHQVLAGFTRLLFQRTIWILALLFCAGVAASMWNMSRLSSNLIESQALQNAALYANTIKQARTLYSAEAVSPLKDIPDVVVTHDYGQKPGTIPLPATYLIELGDRISQENPGMSVRLYSDLPFPWRTDGGPRDDFERQALRYLQKNPQETFFRFESFQNRPSLRYAEADTLKPSCVGCHNTYPGTPKTDWKEGDVRGILEITYPLDTFIRQTRAGLQGSLVMLIILSVLALSGLTLVIGRLRSTSKELERRVLERTAALQAANEEIIKEQEKSERLLLNILPESIAKELKEGHNNIANSFAEVTILFADIVGFTELSSQISPSELIDLLNEIFSCFDCLSEKYGLEKIKTIGDAYMVVGGLPIPRQDHAEAIADMALEMQAEMGRFNAQHSMAISIRIGINTGPAIAGVIGTKKFIYDLWGDAVNTASRMESQGLPGNIQVSQATYERLCDRYEFQYRGLIPIKGKGNLPTYFLVNRKISHSLEVVQSQDI